MSFSIKKNSNLVVASPGSPSYWTQSSNNIYNNNSPNNVGVNNTSPVFDLDVSGEVNSFQYCISGIPQQNFYLSSPQVQTVNNVVSTWTIKNTGMPESSISAMAWSPTLSTFAGICQQGRVGRIVVSTDSGNTWPSRVTGIDLSNVTQINLTNCNNGSGNIITCASTVNIFVNTVLLSNGQTPTVWVTNIIDASSFSTNTFLPVAPNATVSTTCMTCTDTSGLLVGMAVMLVSGLGSFGPRSVYAVDPSSNTKFSLTTTRNYSGSFCKGDRYYWSLIWCNDLSGIGQFVGGATSSTSQQILTSSDASGWIRRNTPVGVNSVWSLAYSPTLKRVVGACDTYGFIYSNDGINWIGVTNPLPSTIINNIAWSSELSRFVALGSASANVFTSSDGITWTTTTSTTLPPLSYASLVWSPELRIFCAVSASGSIGGKNVAISSNGTDWEAYSTNEIISFHKMVWSAELGVFAVVGSNKIFFSYNGKQWFSRAIIPVTSIGYRGIAWSPELRLFAAGAANATDVSGVAVSNSATYNIVLNSPTNIPSLIYVPTVSGALSTPSIIPNTVPLVYDTTNNRLYSYNGSWRFLQF
jgi:hypothetical protein